MKLVNLTPHSVVVKGADGVTVLQPSGSVLRVTPLRCSGASVDGMQVTRLDFSRAEVKGLPEIEPDTFYVVSLPALMLLKQAGFDTTQFLSPDTEQGIRDAKGQVIAVTGFISL